MKTGPKPSCLCGTCPKCKSRVYGREHYHGIRRGPWRGRAPEGLRLRRSGMRWWDIA